MIALLQRVSEAGVQVKDAEGNRQVGSIDAGILALLGVEKGDTEKQADRLLERLLAYRMFNDADGKMNLDLRQAGGSLLLIPQFTLAANTDKGNRPGFSHAAPPDEGRRLFDYTLGKARSVLGACETGEFGAHMLVSLVNDGPVTFRLRVAPESH